mgnify:CR=1 FL=1
MYGVKLLDAHKRHYGWHEGQEVFEYVLTNDQQAVFRCINYGAVVTKIEVPDQLGKIENVVLGFNQFEDYVTDSPYFGAFVGRVAGRIADGAWSDYQLTKNEREHHIHGGNQTFSQVVWDSQLVKEQDKIGVSFHLSVQMETTGIQEISA